MDFFEAQAHAKKRTNRLRHAYAAAVSKRLNRSIPPTNHV